MRQLLAILVLSSSSLAQNWAGILDPARAFNWSGAGATIVNRTTRCGSVIAAYTGTAATINNAIAACPVNQYVELGAGTFTLSTGVELGEDNVTLRGQGADLTILDINGNTGVSCHIGFGRRFNICKNGANIGVDSPDNTATWSGGYAQGDTTITLSGHANMIVGSTIWLDQIDTPATSCGVSEGYPGSGDVCISHWGNANSFARNNRGLVEGHIVTACGTSTPGAACTSDTITINPPIISPLYRSGQTPGAWWGNTSSVQNGTGVENLTIDYTGGAGVFVINCTGCWMKGVRMVSTSTVSGENYGLETINAMNLSVVDNYIYGFQSTTLVAAYGIATYITSYSLFQNNIIQASVNPFVINSPTYGSVFAYNTFDNTGVSPSFSQSSFILHGQAGMNLFEGNNQRNFSGDNIHSPHFMTTLFRNHFDGTSRNPSGTETQGANTLYAAQRFFNMIGNVFGSNQWSVYKNSQPPTNNNCQTAIYCWGWRGTNSTGAAATGDDLNVNRTAMLWGNWDLVTSTNDTGTNDSTGTRFVSGEVPSGITNFPNPLPGSTTLPASFYLSSRPNAWWKVGSTIPAWPPIGPDVANGDAPNTASTPTGGHANLIPSRLCFNSMSNDPAYPSSSPRIKLFNADDCYQDAGPESTPTLGIQGQIILLGNSSAK